MDIKANLNIIGILFLLGNLTVANAIVLDTRKLKNDKEVTSTSLSKKTQQDIKAHPLSKEETSFYETSLYQSLTTYSEGENLKCELKLISLYEAKIQTRGSKLSQKRINQELRVSHSIDDILYDLLNDISTDYNGLKAVKTKGAPRRVKSSDLDKWDLNKLYSNFKTWPDEDKICVFQEFIQLKEKITPFQKKTDYRLLSKLNALAYHEKIIDLETYYKLDYLTNKSVVKKRRLWLQDYLKIVMLAKNNMVPRNQKYEVKDFASESNFASKKLKRFSKLTQRKLLYRKYDETQIILLANILKKSSQRMGVDVDTKTSKPFITQEFTTTNEDGEEDIITEKIVIDPQSQYNLARRLLRKDMTELQMMDSFRLTKVTFDDVVMAALETGYISLDDLTPVVQYDDLWNPHKTKFERVRSFIFNVAGYGTFFIPTPWNISASIALGVVENLVDNFYSTGEDNDNPATFIE